MISLVPLCGGRGTSLGGVATLAVNPPGLRLGQEMRIRKVNFREREEESPFFPLHVYVSFLDLLYSKQCRGWHLCLEVGREPSVVSDSEDRSRLGAQLAAASAGGISCSLDCIFFFSVS